MKEILETITGPSGTSYEIATAYGVLNQLEGSGLENLPDETMNKVKAKLMHKRKRGKVSTKEEDLAVFEVMTPNDFREFMGSNRKQRPHILATVLRTADGEDLGDYDDRMDFVMNAMPGADGKKIVEHITDLMDGFQEGVEDEGESAPSSSKRSTGRKKKATASQ